MTRYAKLAWAFRSALMDIEKLFSAWDAISLQQILEHETPFFFEMMTMSFQHEAMTAVTRMTDAVQTMNNAKNSQFGC